MKKINVYKPVEDLRPAFGLSFPKVQLIDPRIGTLPNELITIYLLKYYFTTIRNTIENQSKRIKVE